MSSYNYANVSLNTAFGATTVSNITASNITASNITASNVNISGNALFRTYSEYVSNVTAAAGTTTIDFSSKKRKMCTFMLA